MHRAPRPAPPGGPPKPDTSPEQPTLSFISMMPYLGPVDFHLRCWIILKACAEFFTTYEMVQTLYPFNIGMQADFLELCMHTRPIARFAVSLVLTTELPQVGFHQLWPPPPRPSGRGRGRGRAGARGRGCAAGRARRGGRAGRRAPGAGRAAGGGASAGDPSPLEDGYEAEAELEDKVQEWAADSEGEAAEVDAEGEVQPQPPEAEQDDGVIDIFDQDLQTPYLHFTVGGVWKHDSHVGWALSGASRGLGTRGPRSACGRDGSPAGRHRFFDCLALKGPLS